VFALRIFRGHRPSRSLGPSCGLLRWLPKWQKPLFLLWLIVTAVSAFPSSGPDVAETFTTDPVLGGRFIQQTSNTESSFVYDALGKSLRAVLDVDADAAYYLSTPFAPVTETNDVSFSVIFQVQAVDTNALPTAFFGLVTAQHVDQAGDGLTLELATTDGNIVARASVDDGGDPPSGVPPAKREGSEIALSPYSDYLAFGSYSGDERQFTLEVYDGPNFTHLAGRSSARLDPGRSLLLNRLGLQNGGGHTTDSSVGSFTVVVKSLLTPGQPPININIADTTVLEADTNSTTAVFVLTLSAPNVRDVTVDYTTLDGTANGGKDYQPISGSLTFPAGQTTASVSVEVIGDRLVEASETFQLLLSNPVNANLSDTYATATILDNDQTAIAIDPAAVIEGNTGTTNMQFRVTLSLPSALPVSVAYTTIEGTATADVDFVKTDGTFTFAPGQTNGVIAIPVRGDTEIELPETFIVQLSNPLNALLRNAQARGTIIDDDGTPVVVVRDQTLSEGDAGPLGVALTITLSNPTYQTVTVPYSIINGSATSGVDYFANPGVLTFTPGATNAVIPVTIVGDRIYENDETFFVVFGSPINATLSTNQLRCTIVNDDPTPIVSIDDAKATEGNPGDANEAIFHVSLSNPSSETIVIHYATADGSARANSDYIPSSGLLTFSAGETNKTIAVTIIGDNIPEDNETFFVNLISVSGHADVADSQGLGTINDDDGVAIFVNDSNVVEGDSGTTNLSFAVTLSTVSAQTVTVSYSTQDGTARAGSDYLSTNGSLSFPPGTTKQLVTVQVIGDQRDEPDETLYLNLSNPGNARIAAASAVGTILDDDPPEISINDTQVTEGLSGTTPALFQVSLSSPSAQEVRVDYVTADGTATTNGLPPAGIDYLATNGTVVFPPGSTSQIIRVLVYGDNVDENDEAFLVNLSNAVNAKLLRSQGVGTIIDDDPQPTAYVDDLSVNECDQGTTTAIFTVRLSNPSSFTLTIPFQTVDGSAIAGKDYVGLTNMLVFLPGETSKTISVVIACDMIDEPNRSFGLSLGGGPGFGLGDGFGQATIVDNDPPDISIQGTSVFEGDGGTTNAVFAVTLSSVGTNTISVDYSTADETATAGVDYFATSGTLTFLPGETNKPVIVLVRGDTLSEPNETFLVNLANPLNARIAVPSARGTIIDDDKPHLTINDPFVTEGNPPARTSAVFAISLGQPSSQLVKVDFATSDIDSTNALLVATRFVDYIPANGTLTFQPGETNKTVNVQIIGDLIEETNEMFALKLSNAVGAIIDDPQGVATILDDDPPPTISIKDTPVAEGDLGQNAASFSLTLSAPSAYPVSVHYATSDGSAKAPADYFPASGLAVFAPGQTNRSILVTIQGDTIFEPDEIFYVNLSNPTNATLARSQAACTIQNDDSPPAITIDDVASLEGNHGTTTNIFRVHLSHPSSEITTVDYATADGTATAASDYRSASGTLIFQPGETSQTVNVLVNGDTVNEPDETFLVNLSNNSANSTLARAQAVGTIRNDDNIVVQISNATVTEGDSSSVPVNANFYVTLSGPAAETVTVDFTTQDGTAVGDLDFRRAAGTLSFAPGQTNLPPVVIQVLGNTIDQPNRTFYVRLSNPVNARDVGPPGVGTIIDNDPPEIRIDDVAVNAGVGVVTASFHVVLSSASDQIVSVDYITQNGTANDGGDYEKTSGTLPFPPGATNLPINVVVKGNTVDETTEEFYVNLSNPRGATLARSQGMCTVLNDYRTNQGPQVQLLVPANGSVFVAPLDLGLVASAVDPDGNVASVEFFNRKVRLGSALTAPYKMTWTDVQPGVYELNATATDTNQATALSSPVRVTVLPPPLDCAVEVYRNTFQGAVGMEWSSQSTSFTPNGARGFLGRFGNGPVTLGLDHLPPHGIVVLSFDLLVIQSWDGNSTTAGPDIWSLQVEGGPTLLQTTFATSGRQAFPDAYPGGDWQAETQASETNTLGYLVAGVPSDSVYKLTNVLAHTDSSLKLAFSAVGLEGLGNESWGLDNVLVRVISDEPPLLVSQPTNQVVTAGGTAVFSVTALSTPPLSYQWRFDLTNLSGATNESLTLTNVTPAHAGSYDVVISSCVGATNSQAAALTVNSLRHPPVVVLPGDQAIDEDSTLAGLQFSVFDQETPADALTINVISSNNALLSATNISIDGTGTNRTLTIRPAPDQFGETAITVTATDADGMSAGGTFSIVVRPVNDPPSFKKGPDIIVNESAGPQTNVNWATAVSPGPPNEADQKLTFTLTPDNPGLFSVQPALATNGTLTFTPAANSNGVANVTVVLKDDGGTANGGTNASSPQTFRITVQLVNHAPSFTKGPDITVNEDAGPQTNVNWATAISPGPPNEAGQKLTFMLTPDNPGLFSVQPALATNGTLTFTPAANSNGVANVTVVLKDDGGTANGGHDASAPQNLTITVTNLSSAALTVWITTPANFSSYCLGVDLQIPVQAVVSNSSGRVEVQFLVGNTTLGTTASDPYRWNWQSPQVGSYVLRARATDSLGRSAESPEINVTIADECADIAIVRPKADPEIDALQTYLYQMGLGSQVFNQPGLSVSQLQGFKVVVWDDLGLLTNGLAANTVDVLSQLHNNGMPLYLAGEHLASCLPLLPLPQQNEWTNLTQLSIATGTGGDGAVAITNPEEHSNPILAGTYGVVDSFSYPPRVDLATDFDQNAEVFGTTVGASVLAASPGLALPDQGTRLWLQNVRILPPDSPSSADALHILFQNAVCWLKGCSLCSDTKGALAGVQSNDVVEAGQTVNYTLYPSFGGECPPTGVTLTNQLPDGFQFISATSDHGSWTNHVANGQVVFFLGLVETNELVTLSISAAPLQSGIFTNTASLRFNSSYPELATAILDPPLVTTVLPNPAPALMLQVVPPQNLLFTLSGQKGMEYEIESSPDLSHWAPLTNVLGPTWTQTIKVGFGTKPSVQFYRARVSQ